MQPVSKYFNFNWKTMRCYKQCYCGFYPNASPHSDSQTWSLWPCFGGDRLNALPCSNDCDSLQRQAGVFLLYLSNFSVGMYLCLKLIGTSVELAVPLLWERHPAKWLACSEPFGKRQLPECFSIVSSTISHYDFFSSLVHFGHLYFSEKRITHFTMFLFIREDCM